MPPPRGCLLWGCLLQGVSAPGVGVCSQGGWWRPTWDGYCCGWYASYWNAFLFQKCVSRILSKGGVCPIACWDTQPSPRTRGRHSPEQTHTPRSRHPPEEPPGADTPALLQCMLGDTGKKRVVRILLECILV